MKRDGLLLLSIILIFYNELQPTPTKQLWFESRQGHMKQPYTFNNDDTDSDDELVFNTLGTSINDAFGVEPEDDVDECEFDVMDDRDYE